MANLLLKRPISAPRSDLELTFYLLVILGRSGRLVKGARQLSDRLQVDRFAPC